MTKRSRPDDMSDGDFPNGGRSRSRPPSREAQAQADRPGGPAAGAPLVIIGNYSASQAVGTGTDGYELQSVEPLKGKARRFLADRARALIAETCGHLAEAAKIRSCGVNVKHGNSMVSVERHLKGYAYASGLQTCGSVWACPICSFKIRLKRAAELAVAIAVHQANGGTVLLLTLTTQHSFGESLDEVWSVVQDTWAFVTGHYRYRKLRDRLGIGFVRTMEVMHGLNGWHPHLHVLLFCDAPVDPFDTPDEYHEIGRTFHDLWVKRMEEKHGRDVRSSYGVDLRLVKGDGADGVGMYCTKAGWEVALADGKQGRTSTSRHPFAIAFDAVENGDAADIALFQEWVKGSHGRHMWSWSKGLRQKLRLGAERTDEELAAEAEESVEQICVIAPELWTAIAVTRRGLRSRFLSFFDTAGEPVGDQLPVALAFLAGHGLEVVVETRSSGVPLLRLPDEQERADRSAVQINKQDNN